MLSRAEPMCMCVCVCMSVCVRSRVLCVCVCVCMCVFVRLTAAMPGRTPVFVAGCRPTAMPVRDVLRRRRRSVYCVPIGVGMPCVPVLSSVPGRLSFVVRHVHARCVVWCSANVAAPPSLCTAGKFSTGNQQTCSDCPAGWYASSDGATSCTTCVRVEFVRSFRVAVLDAC